MLQTHHLLSSAFPFSLSPHPKKFNFLHKPIIYFSAFPRRRPIIEPCLAQAQELTTFTVPTTSADPEEGPVELTQSIFANTDDPSPLQVSTSVLLTGSIAVFLFRALRRRAKRAKELKFRSTKAKKSLKVEALDNLKAMGSSSIEAKDPSFTCSGIVGRNIGRTIVNGLCYLATFVFGINSTGLFLDSGQLAINSFMEDSSSNETEKKVEQQSGSLSTTAANATDSTELKSSKKDESSDNKGRGNLN